MRPFLISHENMSQFSHWFISDLIPKKSEKFEFRKNFATITYFSAGKTGPKNEILKFSANAIFRKLLKEIPNFRVVNVPEKRKFRKYF